MELETAFHIIAIVFMAIMLILVISLVVAVFVIKARINKLQNTIGEKFGLAKNAAGKAVIGLNTLKYFIKKP
jgi:cell division protein FtsL